MKTQLSYWVTHYHYQFFHTQYVKFLARNQKWENALKEVNLCLEYNPNYIPALWEKAFILEKMKNIKEVRTVYQLLAELYGKSKEKNQKSNKEHNSYRNKNSVKTKVRQRRASHH